jgi:hypothetical protein
MVLIVVRPRGSASHDTMGLYLCGILGGALPTPAATASGWFWGGMAARGSDFPCVGVSCTDSSLCTFKYIHTRDVGEGGRMV